MVVRLSQRHLLEFVERHFLMSSPFLSPCPLCNGEGKKIYFWEDLSFGFKRLLIDRELVVVSSLLSLIRKFGCRIRRRDFHV